MNQKLMMSFALALGLCATASAASIYDPCTASAVPACSFDMSGIITVSGAGTITWNSDQAGNLPNLFTLTNGKNVFSVITSSSQESIQNLNLATAPVGTTFGPLPFIAFPTNPTLPGLNINFIFPGIYSTATCGGAPAVGQSCTPALPLAGNPPGPFNFVNNPPGPPDGPQATATFVFSGVTADGAARWQANFTSQFFVPFQTVLAQLQSQGSVQNTYSATSKVTVTIAAIPEPATLALTGGVMLLLGLILRRRTAHSRLTIE